MTFWKRSSSLALALAVLALTPQAHAESRCRPVAKALRRDVDALLRAAYLPRLSPSKTIVEVGCDSLAGDVREIDIETGSREEATLRLWRIDRDGDHWRVTGALCEGQGCAVMHARGELPAAAVNDLLPLVRGLLVSTVTDRATAEGGPVGSILSLSKAEMHRVVRIVDTDGHRIERAFTGHDDNGPAEADRLAAAAAAEKLEALLASVPRERRAAAPAERSFFAERFTASFGTAAPWLRQRLVAMAAKLGSPELEPALADLAKSGGDVAPAAADALEELKRAH